MDDRDIHSGGDGVPDSRLYPCCGLGHSLADPASGGRHFGMRKQLLHVSDRYPIRSPEIHVHEAVFAVGDRTPERTGPSPR